MIPKESEDTIVLAHIHMMKIMNANPTSEKAPDGIDTIEPMILNMKSIMKIVVKKSEEPFHHQDSDHDGEGKNSKEPEDNWGDNQRNCGNEKKFRGGILPGTTVSFGKEIGSWVEP